jgi:hypothetical protein
MIDVYEPLEEGLDKVENKRYVSCMTITLFRLPDNAGNEFLDDTIRLHIGYQPPLMEEQQQQQQQQLQPMTSV